MIESKEQITQAAERIAALKEEIGSVIVGQKTVVEQLLWCMLAGGHALLEGIPGLGKTMLVRTVADTISLQYSRIQFTPDLMPADITGTTLIDFTEQGAAGRSFQPGPIFGNLVLADEINRATPKTQSALLEAMQEGTVTAGGETRQLPRPFLYWRRKIQSSRRGHTRCRKRSLTVSCSKSASAIRRARSSKKLCCGQRR